LESIGTRWSATRSATTAAGWSFRSRLSGRRIKRCVSTGPDICFTSAGPVLTHRLILRPESRLRKLTAAAVVADLVADQRVPMLSNETDGV